MIGIGVVSFAIAAAIAVFIPWLPPPATREAGRIVFVYWFATWISLFVFAVVTAVLVYCLLKFRVKDDDLSDGPPVHGHTMLEIVWTTIPFILVSAISFVSAIVVAQNSHAGAHPLKIKVVGQQFAWQFTYPDGKTYTSMHLPVNTHVELSLTSKDVIHSFWVPEFNQKMDAVPGMISKIVITPDRIGNYDVICTELCGLGHSLMRSQAIVMTQADYDAWYKAGAPAAPAGGDPGLAVFNANNCGACHVFKAAGAVSKVGPSLDDLQAQADRAGQPLEDFARQSIVDPNGYLEPTYQAGLMPANYGTTIPSDQIDQLVQYLVKDAG
ncbi:MAG: cytochrome c oxidase subunit II [Actinomycetes bacterium]